jgi:DNA-binding transcriptional MerR regulator
LARLQMTRGHVASGSGRNGEMKIQDLAARTGVSKPTIHFYVEKGLLPRPRKANRTMAYYSEDCVERIRLIREFQEKAFMPLERIKHLLSTVQDTGILRNILVISTQYAALSAGTARPRSMTEAEARREFGFTHRRLTQLEKLGILDSETRRGRRVYRPEDVEILKILVRMRERGFTPARGWPSEGLAIYSDAAARLAEKEVGQLFDRIAQGLDPEDAETLFNNAGEDILLGLFLWMRRKATRKEFAKRVKQMKSKM